MKPCTKDEYVSLISRCDSPAMVSKTSEDFPDPETPATVKRRFGMLTETLRRLFSLAPVTTMASWATWATCAPDVVGFGCSEKGLLPHQQATNGGAVQRT